MGLSLCLTPTGVGGGISPIIMRLVEDMLQVRPTSIGVQFKRLSKIGIGKNGCCGAQALQAIKEPLAPVIPGGGHPFLTIVLAGCQFMQGSGYLDELRDEPVIVSHEPKKALDLSDGGGVGDFLIAYIFPHQSLFLGQRQCAPGI